MMFEKVKEIIELQLPDSGADITPDTSLINDLGINSLTLVELVCAFEQEFGIEVPEQKIRRFRKVKDISDYLETTLRSA